MPIQLQPDKQAGNDTSSREYHDSNVLPEEDRPRGLDISHSVEIRLNLMRLQMRIDQ